MKNVPGKCEGVAVRVQVAGVFLQQGQDAIELLVSPASESGGVLELAFHGVALGTTSGSQRATVPIGPGMGEAKEAQDLDDLIGDYVDTWAPECIARMFVGEGCNEFRLISDERLLITYEADGLCAGVISGAIPRLGGG